MATADDRQDGSLVGDFGVWSDHDHDSMDHNHMVWESTPCVDSLSQNLGSPLPLITDSADSATEGSLGRDALYDPAYTEAGIDRSTGLDLNNVLLSEGNTRRPEVLCKQVFALHCSYIRHLEYQSVAPAEGPAAAFPHCSVFNKPPGYEHQLALALEEVAGRSDPSCFPMSQAVCIVDESRGTDPHRAKGDCVSFEGKSKFYPPPDQGLGEDGNLFVARKGGDKIPHGKTIKNWKFQIVRGKGEDKSPLDKSIYICVFLPYSPSPCTPQSKTACPERDTEDQVLPVMIEKFVAAVATEQHRKGNLTGGDEQVEHFRKEFTKALKNAMPLCIGPIGHSSSLTWADKVFTPSYKQYKIEQVWEFIDMYGHLPWIRPEDVVQKTGFDPERDHVNLLESVENLFLYFRSMSEKVGSLQEFQPPSRMPAQLDPIRREFLTRVLSYSNLSPKITANHESSKLDKRETRLIAQEIVTLLPKGEEEKHLQEDVTHIARMSRGKLSKVDALDMANEAARRKNEGETNKTACGEFFALCKQKWDPLHHLYMKQSREIYLEQHVPLSPRKYQEEMANKAISCNTLLVAPTNSGKTKVIAMVLDDMWRNNPCAKAIFVAENIPLVLQQARNLKKWCTPFQSTATFPVNAQVVGPSIGAYGSFNPCPDPEKTSWEDFLARHDLFVFIPETLKNLLTKGKVSLSMFEYFVIDEAHHTTKDHPFNVLMNSVVMPGRASSDQGLKQPKILAVTATVGGKMDLEQSLAHLHNLAANVNSAVFSENNLSNHARDELHACTRRSMSQTRMTIEMSPLQEWFEQTAKKLATEMRERAAVDGHGRELAEFFRAFASTLEYAIKVADDCGVCQALVWFAGEYLSTMCINQRPESPAKEWVEMRVMLSQLFSNIHEIKVFEGTRDLPIDSQGYVLDVEPLKRKHLLDQLEALKKGTSATAFKCIVFLNTRHGVKVLLDHLCALEKAASESQNDKQLHALFGGADKLKVRKFVGKGTKTVSESGASQEITRQHFLTGECNLLLTTSVAEEGLDFPACNAVIMMNGADNDISLKQREGRVRADGKVVIFFKNSLEEQRYQQAMAQAQNAETALKYVVQARGESDAERDSEKEGEGCRGPTLHTNSSGVKGSGVVCCQEPCRG